MNYGRVVWMTFLAFGVALPLEAATATWDRSPESNVTGYRLSYGTQSGVHPTSIDVGNVLTYQFFPPAGARYYVVVQAYNSSGTLSAKSTEVIVDLTATPPPQPPPPANQPPAFAQPANQTSAQNTAASLTLVASDPEGSIVTYSATGLPAGLSLNGLSGVISGTATTAGAYNVTASAFDGLLTTDRSFTWTVTGSSSGQNTLWLTPADTSIDIFGANYVNDTRLYTYTYPANRIGQAIVMKFDLSQIPAGAVIESAALEMHLIEMDGYTGEPNYNVTLHQIINRNPDVTRATGATADGVSAWTPNACCYNSVPMAQSDITPARAVVAVDRSTGVKTWDATQIVQAWRTAPASNYGMLLNGDATKGIDRYRAFASAQHATAAMRPSLRIVYSTSSPPPSPPPAPADTTAPTVSLTAPGSGATVSGSNVTVSASASDAVGVVGVQFRLDGVDIGAEDTVSPYSVTWNTVTVTNGSHQLTAVARDAAGNTTTSAARTVNVNNVAPNRAPILVQPANQTSAEGAVVSVALSGSDPDGTPVTFSASGLPAGLSINPATGLISGTPSYTSAGTFTVSATVSDGSLTASRTFSWVIQNTNRAPSLEQPANQASAARATVSLQLSATDPDGTPITYQATGLPPGLTINASTGLISGRLSQNAASVYSVVATASDGSMTSSRTFAWSIGGADTPLTGDFDGDGRPDPATFRRATGEWRVWLSSANFAGGTPVVWGTSTDLPVHADYDGDGRTDIGVYRPSTGTWHVLLSSTNMQSDLQIRWGSSTDQPLPLDYDGDGRADLALPRTGGFDILLSRSNYTNSVTVR